MFGVEAAARHYFGKSSSELTALKATRLVAVLPNPRRYDLRSEKRYVVSRSRLIYSIMIKRGIVVPEYREIEESTEDKQVPIERLSPSD